jgi:hypothetical protein
MILFLASGPGCDGVVSDLFIFGPPVSQRFSLPTLLRALSDPLFDFAFQPGRCHFPDAPALRKSPLAHHAPDRGSAEGYQVAEFFESDVSHFIGLLSQAETIERFVDNSIRPTILRSGRSEAAPDFPL